MFLNSYFCRQFGIFTRIFPGLITETCFSIVNILYCESSTVNNVIHTAGMYAKQSNCFSRSNHISVKHSNLFGSFYRSQSFLCILKINQRIFWNYHGRKKVGTHINHVILLYLCFRFKRSINKRSKFMSNKRLKYSATELLSFCSMVYVGRISTYKSMCCSKPKTENSN